MDQNIAEYFRSWATFRAHHSRIPGWQIAVREDRRLVDGFAGGFADVEASIPSSSTTLYRVASQSKTLTAMLVLRLVERRRLGLDDTVAMWVPALSEHRSGDATIQQLLSHRAGISRDGEDGDYWILERDFPDEAEVVSMVAHDRTVDSMRGRFKYSNLGFALLGMIVSAAAEAPYAVAAQDVIVGPLGLQHTGPEFDPSRRGEYAVGYTGDSHLAARRPLTMVSSRGLAAAGGWYSTAIECSAMFTQILEGSEILSSASALRLRQPAWETGDGDASYGFGLQVERPSGDPHVGHPGGWVGHASSTVVNVEQKLVTTVLTNAIDGPAHDLALGMLRLSRLASDAKHTRADVSATRFCGRYVNIWSAWDIVLLGHHLYCINPRTPDPTSGAIPLEQVSDTVVRVVGENGNMPVGEEFTFEGAGSGFTHMIGPSRMRYDRWHEGQQPLPEQALEREVE